MAYSIRGLESDYRIYKCQNIGHISFRVLGCCTIRLLNIVLSDYRFVSNIVEYLMDMIHHIHLENPDQQIQ